MLKDDPLLGLGKERDFLKDINLLQKDDHVKKEDKKSEEDKFKLFDFITKQQSRYLIEILKQPVFFDHLPKEGQDIFKVFI